MKRKIIIDKCSDCPFVESEFNGLAVSLVKTFSRYRLFCNHEMNADRPEEITTLEIPQWCQLEKE